MTSKERVRSALKHKSPDKVAIDFGSTAVTGIHVLAIEKLRNHFGLEKRPVKVIEPYQMLGEIEDDLMELMGIDVIGFGAKNNMFGFPNEGWMEFRTFWGQEVLVPERFNTEIDENGDLVIFPEGDTTAPASGKMPQTGYFFDTIVRQDPIEEDKLNPEDNLEEFKPLGEEDLAHWQNQLPKIKETDKGVIINIGGTAFGDIALVPAPFMKYPKGIRDISEWYMSTVMRAEYVHTIFEKQSEIALHNLEKVFGIVGNHVDAIFICGTDFGTQNSQFCSVDTFNELYAPYYKKLNDWIHKHTTWKTFKHSCGAVEPLIKAFVDCGFDILNPVQINAVGMDPARLKEVYGDQITFWGGGVDTQKILPFGTPGQIKDQIKSQIDILGENGGFIFNAVHNVQANVPAENLVALVEALREGR